MADSGAVQSRLLTIVAAFGPSKRSSGSICLRMRSTQPETTSRSLSVRSPAIFGSPIRPVAPPTSANGRWPASCRRRTVRIWTRLPMCRLGAVGSNPQ